VALDDDVENAVRRGVAIFFICFIGFARPRIFTDRGKVIRPWINNPRRTVRKYNPSLLITSLMLLPISTCWAITLAEMLKIPMGVNLIIKRVIFITTSSAALMTSINNRRGFSFTLVIKKPHRMAKNIIDSICPCIRDSKILEGTIFMSV